ncbi:TRAP transporter small permease subunit [Rhodobacter sphaeroides]|uniref:TRAP transporter small permease protein n=1 Tax=Cereibacter sphaeroides (strain ATCC 17023 / DSM 158 / JCM 6121 / CCUG 31486 / LMG 2827 / NBRC 12203 / NCIMB 8253 / ATH 2.4.1.) TaxID=272943 RepID=Q3J0M7_CERS4|nr:TRAP transporter small permease [Cereibacter sphaeroides]ABA79657.1 TRAP-T family transporter, DctQ (4 TMs) subunit [Cereibacter sphaeroides 2.4.1]AMJ47945.1 C4-dicarboxylate ABC transporter [Cereibacter sphaeroides]ANS34654.1 C4-dicarboxylate ABC transporter [Cereibacter sphaeroides]ATN63702.1 C4-dicarboxylate ABC transporter [Cereibacter sphaeroides]AXC61870.1 TRAP transporter small permease [Cereibacter sphaeroides 2.4.1]
MQDGLKRLALVMGGLARIALWIAGGGLVLMTVFVFAQVFVRYVMNDSLHWAEPAAVMIMAWFIFLGAAVGVREGYHLSFDVLLYFLPKAVAPWLHTISDFFVAAFGFGMAWYGWSLAARAANDLMPGLGISRGFEFAPLISGGTLLVLFSIERVLRRAAGLHTARFGEDAPEEPETTTTGA